MYLKSFKNKWTKEEKHLEILNSVDFLTENEKSEAAKFINSKFYHHNPDVNIENVLSDDEVKFIKDNPSLIYKSNLGAAYREVNLPKQKEEKGFYNSPFAYVIAGIILLFIIIMNLPKGSSTNSMNTSTETTSTSETESTTSQVEDKESTTTCSICGREFTGLGYHEVSEGVWELCNEPYQCQICSRQCGMKHTKNWEDIEQSIQNNSNTSETEDIISYIESHTFSYSGNGSVTFNGGVLTVSGGRATLSGDYDKISDKSIRYKLQAIYGDFDASNNRGSYGTFYLNSNGTLTQNISDGVTTKTYTLTPE